MRHLAAIVLLALCRASVAAGPTNADPLYWTYQYVIAMSDGELMVPYLVFDLQRVHPQWCDPPMLDLLAEFLETANVRDPAYSRGIKEIFGILEKGEAARYRGVAIRVAKRATVDSIKTAAYYFARNHGQDVPQYVPGTIDRAALRRQYARDALAARHPPDIAPRLRALARKTTAVEEQFAIAGTPDAVTGQMTQVWVTPGIQFHMPYLVYYYRGIGSLAYQYKNGLGWVFLRADLSALAYEPRMPYRAFAAEFQLPDDAAIEMAMLLSDDASAVRVAAQTSHDRPATPAALFLDTAAEVLLAKYRAATTPGERDALGWICRLLSHRGGARYAAVLRTVAETVSDEKLKRFAALEIEAAPGMDPRAYVAGTLDLAQQRREYPNPYPPLAAAGGTP